MHMSALKFDSWQTLSNLCRSNCIVALSLGQEGRRLRVPVLDPGYAFSRNSSQTADSQTTFPLYSRIGTRPRGLRSNSHGGFLLRLTYTVSCLHIIKTVSSHFAVSQLAVSYFVISCFLGVGLGLGLGVRIRV